MPRRPARDDPALRQSYLEAYASRNSRERLTRIHTRLKIRQQTVDHWMSDPDFRKQIEDIDRRRLQAATEIAATFWPAAVEEQARIACGMPEQPPDVEQLTPRQFSIVKAAYNARQAKRVTMSTRATELLADILGARKRGAEVNIVGGGISPDHFGMLPDDPKGLLAEIDRLDGIMERYKRRMKGESSGSPGTATATTARVARKKDRPLDRRRRASAAKQRGSSDG